VVSRSYDLLLFDLDGTLTDPIVGFTRCLNYALGHFGYQLIQPADAAKHVGPPIDEAFRALANVTDEGTIRALVAKYRERYSTIGFAETAMYPGIDWALEALHRRGVPMAVCTSKRVDFAQKIVALLGLRDRFLFVSGGDIGVSKVDQIEELRRVGAVDGECLLIGDRGIDLVAAHRNGLTGGAVLWGYGSRAELEAERPRYVFNEPSEWARLARMNPRVTDASRS
jgi:phosphoglycolate phosphatase